MGNNKIQIKRCTENDLAVIIKIGYETYDDTFRSMNTPQTMDTYLAAAFSRDRIKSELSNPYSSFFLLYSGQEIAGYIKTNIGSAQTDIHDDESIELERIYVRSRYKSRGFGKYLLNYAISLGKELSKKYIWLGVWEKNEAALAFYHHMGFEKFDTHTFRMGDEIQHDYLLKCGISL